MSSLIMFVEKYEGEFEDMGEYLEWLREKFEEDDGLPGVTVHPEGEGEILFMSGTQSVALVGNELYINYEDEPTAVGNEITRLMMLIRAAWEIWG
jgi:hypothetical protein